MGVPLWPEGNADLEKVRPLLDLYELGPHAPVRRVLHQLRPELLHVLVRIHSQLALHSLLHVSLFWRACKHVRTWVEVWCGWVCTLYVVEMSAVGIVT